MEWEILNYILMLVFAWLKTRTWSGEPDSCFSDADFYRQKFDLPTSKTVYFAAGLFSPLNTFPGCQGVPSKGKTKRSRPQYPAVFQARIKIIERGNNTGLMLAVPAIMKFQFIRPPKKAATAVNRPRIRATPTR